MKNRILEMDLDENGVLSERTPDAGSESFLDNSLLDRLYPGIKACRIKVCEGMLETFQQAKIAGTMMAFEYQGTAYSVVGASGSAKNGLFYCVEKQYEDAVRKRMDAWPEAALSYFGILTSTLKTMVEEPRCSVLLVPDLQLGTNDCRGWVRQTLFDKLSLPAGRFYQFRLAMDNSLQAKGAFKVMDDATADHLGADIVLPSSSIKPFPQKMHVPSGGIRLRSRVALGVREISRPLEFASSYTLIEHAPKESLLEEIFPQAVREVRALKQAWTEGRHDALVEKIGGKCFDPDDQQSDEEQRAVEALLLADSTGEISRHPYVHYQLDKMLAKWAFKTLTGGGFSMPAFALADDGYLLYQDGHLYAGADWLPLHQAITTVESHYGLCVRYPIRMAEDLLPMHHLSPNQVAACAEQRPRNSARSSRADCRRTDLPEARLRASVRDGKTQWRRFRFRHGCRGRFEPLPQVRLLEIQSLGAGRRYQDQGEEDPLALVQSRLRCAQRPWQSDRHHYRPENPVLCSRSQ